MRFVLRSKLTVEEANLLIDGARRFFVDNPRRRVFWVGDGDRRWFKVRRSSILDDVREHAVPGVKLHKQGWMK